MGFHDQKKLCVVPLIKIFRMHHRYGTGNPLDQALELLFLFFLGGGRARSLGKVTKRHEGQLVAKNALKVDSGLRVSRPNSKRAGNGLGVI